MSIGARARRAVVALRDFVGRTSAETRLTFALVAAAVVFVFVQLQPHLIFADTTPTGGDMGAHVWGPAYLRDHLLSQGRLTGWAPDWYAGFPAFHFYMVVPSLLIVALDLVLPYGVAFKLISVSGLLTLPVAAWALGRLARMSFPTPAFLAVGTLPFLFSPLFTIYGGNVASTLAGEFAFSISLSLALVFLGLVLRGLDTGRHRTWAAAVLALCVLCHVIPAIFAVAGAAVALALRASKARLAWLAGAGIVGGLLTSFWTVPFLLQRAHMNDMGWTKITTYWESLFPGRLGIWLTQNVGGQGTVEVKDDLTLVILLAVVGLVSSVAYRRHLGIFLGVLAAVIALAFVIAPESRLWNARLLPFWYLCLYLLAAVALAETALSVAAVVGGRREAVSRATLRGAAALGALIVVVGVGLPLRSLPFGQESPAGEYSWAGFSTTERSFIPGWAEWNFSGLERKDAYPEYQALMATMDDLGRSRGCGRAMWEFESELNRYGSTMALMLLPHWTDGCIDSMEGLFFESSMTTPFHFLNQSELSSKPSRPQRDLPYTDLDVAQGVDHLQLLGVRYYMAFSDEALRQARAEPDLRSVASSGPWRVFEVAGSSLVEPLDVEPVVLEGAAAGGEEWLEPAVEWYNDPSAQDVLIAADGPASWARVDPGEVPPHRPVAPSEVSGIETSNHTISFTVDRPGAPVLVKTSYFPNWKVEGAEGPYQVAPNLMAVVPTGTDVTLNYEDTAVDQTGQDMTMLGAIGLVMLAQGGLKLRLPSRRSENEEDGAEQNQPRVLTRLAVPLGARIDVARVRAWARKLDPVHCVLAAVILTWSLVFFYLGWVRHDRFGTFGFDLGIYDQGIYLLSRFEEPFVTVRGLNLFGHHANFILVLLAPFYRLGIGGPIFLLFVQVASQASGAVAVYLLAKARLNDRWLAVGLAVVLLLHPTFQFQVLHFFHPDALAIGPVLFAYWAARVGKWRWFAFAAVLAIACKEDVSLAIAAMGALIAMRGDRRIGVTILVGSLGYYLIATRVLMPEFLGGLKPFYDSFFGEFGASPGEVARNVVLHPAQALSVATGSDRLDYYRMMFAPVAFLPLASLPTLLVAAPMLAVNSLTTWPYAREIQFHYSSLVLVGIILATVEGIARVTRKPGGRRFLVGLVMATSLASTVAWGPSPVSTKFRSGIWPLERSARVDTMEAAAALVPDGARVSAIYYFVPQLTHREGIYEFPAPWTPANWGVDGEGLHDPSRVEWLVLDRLLLNGESLELANRLLSEEFRIRFDQDGILVAERHTG